MCCTHKAVKKAPWKIIKDIWEHVAYFFKNKNTKAVIGAYHHRFYQSINLDNESIIQHLSQTQATGPSTFFFFFFIVAYHIAKCDYVDPGSVKYRAPLIYYNS